MLYQLTKLKSVNYAKNTIKNYVQLSIVSLYICIYAFHTTIVITY